MTEVYKLLAKFVPSGFGPGHWVADETISAPDLRQGATVGFTEIENIHSAAKIYGDILAEKEFGESYSALVVSPDAQLCNGVIFEMEAGTPSSDRSWYLMEPVRFAVLATTKP